MERPAPTRCRRGERAARAARPVVAVNESVIPAGAPPPPAKGKRGGGARPGRVWEVPLKREELRDPEMKTED